MLSNSFLVLWFVSVNFESFSQTMTIYYTILQSIITYDVKRESSCFRFSSENSSSQDCPSPAGACSSTLPVKVASSSPPPSLQPSPSPSPSTNSSPSSSYSTLYPPPPWPSCCLLAPPPLPHLFPSALGSSFSAATPSLRHSPSLPLWGASMAPPSLPTQRRGWSEGICTQKKHTVEPC